MSGSVDELASRLVSGGHAITRANRVGVEKAALAGKNVMLPALIAAAGGDKKISGVGKSGANVGVRYEVFGYVNVGARLFYTGPVHLINNPVGAHKIAARQHQLTAKGNKRRGAKAVSPKGNPWAAAWVQHPGTKGKKFAEKVEPVVIAQSKKIITQEVRSHLARTFT